MPPPDAPAAASEERSTSTQAIEAGMDEDSFQNALSQAVAEIEAEEGSDDDSSQPAPSTEEDTEDDDTDGDADESDAEEDADEEDDEEDDGEDDEEDGSEEDGEDDDQKLSKSAKERRRLQRRAEEKVRKELTEKHTQEIQQVQTQLAEVNRTFSEHRETSLKIELAAESMLEQLEIYREALGPNGLAAIQPRLDLVAKNHEIRTLKATSENVQQMQQQAAQTAVQQRQAAAHAWVSKLQGMAEAADIQPRRFLFEVREAMAEEPQADPMKLAKRIVKRMSKKGRRRGASGDNNEPPVRPLKGGNGSGSGGAPDHFDVSKHEIGSDGMRDTLKAWLETEDVREAKSR
jgi:hypothetical protein